MSFFNVVNDKEKVKSIMLIGSPLGVILRLNLFIIFFIQDSIISLIFAFILAASFLWDSIEFYILDKALRKRNQYAQVFLDDFVNFELEMVPEVVDIFRNIKNKSNTELLESILKIPGNVNYFEFLVKRDEIVEKIQTRAVSSQNKELLKRQMDFLNYIVRRIETSNGWNKKK